MKTRTRSKLVAYLCMVALAFVGLSTELVLADGSEGGLGAPGISIASGSGVVVAGTGTDTQPATININVPGTSVAQALLYWTGEGDAPGDDSIDVEIDAATHSIVGDLIGGPTYFFNAGSAIYLTTYRADVSSLISTGANTLSITGMDYSFSNSGAGLLVIYDDGSSTAIDIRDGQDLAFARFAPPLDATVPQLFTFDAAGSERTATLDMFFSSVGGNDRPNLLRTTAGGEVTEWANPLGSHDGANWDTLSLSVPIPAFATSVLVEAISWEDGSGNLPASFGWIAASLSLNRRGSSCRITGGGVDCFGGVFVSGECEGAVGQMKRTDGINASTFGGQVGAKNSDFGEWTHVNHSGPSGKWAFHGGTSSSPDGTFMAVVGCNDQPACDPAKANGYHKQINIVGVGTFRNGTPPAGVAVGDLCGVEIHIEDLGEPGKGRQGRQPSAKKCREGGHDGVLVDDFEDCGCPDYYEIRISCDVGGVYQEVYLHTGYLTKGNLQMHESLD